MEVAAREGAGTTSCYVIHTSRCVALPPVQFWWFGVSEGDGDIGIRLQEETFGWVTAFGSFSRVTILDSSIGVTFVSIGAVLTIGSRWAVLEV